MTLRLIWERHVDPQAVRAYTEYNSMLRDGLSRRKALQIIAHAFGWPIVCTLSAHDSHASPGLTGLIPALIGRLTVKTSVQVQNRIPAEFLLQNNTSQLQRRPAVAEHQNHEGEVIAQDNIHAEIPAGMQRLYAHSGFVATRSAFGKNEYRLYTSIDKKSAQFSIG